MGQESAPQRLSESAPYMRPDEWVESPTGSLYPDGPFHQALAAEHSSGNQPSDPRGSYIMTDGGDGDQHTREDQMHDQAHEPSTPSGFQGQPDVSQQGPYRTISETTNWVHGATGSRMSALQQQQTRPSQFSTDETRRQGGVQGGSPEGSFTFAFPAAADTLRDQGAHHDAAGNASADGPRPGNAESGLDAGRHLSRVSHPDS